mgnify:CR=1 FL=1
MNKGLQQIEEKFLNIGDLFAMKFSDGLVFLEVTGWEQNRFSPYDEIGEIPANESSGFMNLEYEGDDILYMDENNTKVIHAALGHSPSHFRRYTNYPEGQYRLRSIPNLSTPRSGDDFGYIDGEDSPYGRPTDAEELFIPPGVHLDFDFYNADTKAHKPLVNIKMREYNVRALNPRRASEAKQIRRIVATGSPMPIVPAGGMDRQIDYELEESWGVRPISFNEARNLGSN